MFSLKKSSSKKRLSSSSHERRPQSRSRFVVVLIFVAALAAGCDEQIVHDLSENDANRVVSRLSAADLGAHKVQQSDGRWAVAVRQEAIVPALSFLESNRVLIARPSGGAKSGIVPSREEQWFRYERAMAQTIEESLGALSGVLEARVHLNLPETDPLFGTRKEAVGSGSVLLLIDSRYSAANGEVAALVAGAAGIPVAQVTVLKSAASPPPVAARPAEKTSEGEALEAASQQPIGAAKPAGGSGLNMPVTIGLAAAVGVAGVVLLSRLRQPRRQPFAFRRLDRHDNDE